MFSDDQKAKLSAPLPRDKVKRLDAKNVDYVDGHYIIQHLNEVFGYDGWEDEYGTPVVRECGNKRPAVYVPAALTVAGVTRRDIGVGVAANDSADSFETAIKAAYTDGLKRCARMLGDGFGLALYEKGTRHGVGYSTKALAMLDDIDALESVAAVNGWAKQHADAVAKLDADERDEVKGLVAHRRRVLSEAPAPAQQPAAADAPASTPPSGDHPAATATAQAASNDTAPAQQPAAAPRAAPLVAILGSRIRFATTEETVVASMCAGLKFSDAEWETLTAETEKTVTARGLDADRIRDRIKKGESLAIPPAQWDAASRILATFDAARTLDEVAAARKEAAEDARQLPDVLIAGIRRAAAERTTALGGVGPTAQKLLARVVGASRDDLGVIHSDLAAALSSGACTKADAAKVTAAMTARAQVAA